MKTVMVTAWVLSVLVAGSFAGKAILDEVRDPLPAEAVTCDPRVSLNFTAEPEKPLAGERVILRAGGPVCGDRVLVWVLPGIVEPLYGSRIEHRFPQAGSYPVTLLLLAPEGSLDLTRILEVASPDAESVVTQTEPVARDPTFTYVFETPKYANLPAELNISTLPVAGTPFAWGLVTHTFHVDFPVHDDGFLMTGLVIYEDYKGVPICGITFPTTNWTYEGRGHWQATDDTCTKRVAGYAERVYLGLCAEFDGFVIPYEQWVTKGSVMHGDKMDQCWQTSMRTPLPV